jgi:hypothetical protein
VLIVHGADDTNVPVSQAEYFHRALRRFGVEHGLPALPTAQQALEWIERQRGRLAEGIGLSFAIADAETNTAVGGLWLQNLPAGRATAGYSVSAKHRGRGAASSALMALTTFAWTIPTLSGRAVHRPVEHRLGTRSGSVGIPERGPTSQPPGNRRYPARHAALCGDTAMTAPSADECTRPERCTRRHEPTLFWLRDQSGQRSETTSPSSPRRTDSRRS